MMERRPYAVRLIVALVGMALSGCHASTEVSSDRELEVCVDIGSATGLGATRPASTARVFALADGRSIELELREVGEKCARFSADIHSSDPIASVTAIEPSIGAITLMDLSADELHLRLGDFSRPIVGATTVVVSGQIIRSENDSSVSITGEGIDDERMYGAHINELHRGIGQESFELVLGGWEGASPTEMYFIERLAEADFSDLPKLSVLNVRRDSDTSDISVDFSQLGYEGWRHMSHRSRFSEGLFSCRSPDFMHPLAYTAPARRRPEVVQALLDCDAEGIAHIEGYVRPSAKWFVQNFSGSFDEIQGGAMGFALIDSENDADYLIPNIASYDLDISAERGVSGSVSLSGANASTSVSLRSFIQTGERELVWDIYTERNDLIEIDPDEYALIREAIDGAIDIESLDYHLQIRDGYDGKPWETASINAVSHHSFFSIRLIPSL